MEWAIKKWQTCGSRHCLKNNMLLTKFLQKLAILIALTFSSYVYADSVIVGGTVTPFFDALRQGNVIAVESYLEDPLLADVKVLLRDNKGYPDFLREYYRGTTVVVTNIESSSESAIAIVNVDIYFPAGHVESLQLDLIKATVGGWKIQQQSTVHK